MNPDLATSIVIATINIFRPCTKTQMPTKDAYRKHQKIVVEEHIQAGDHIDCSDHQMSVKIAVSDISLLKSSLVRLRMPVIAIQRPKTKGTAASEASLLEIIRNPNTK